MSLKDDPENQTYIFGIRGINPNCISQPPVCSNVTINVMSKCPGEPPKDRFEAEVHLKNLKDRIQIDIQQALDYKSEFTYLDVLPKDCLKYNLTSIRLDPQDVLSILPNTTNLELSLKPVSAQYENLTLNIINPQYFQNMIPRN